MKLTPRRNRRKDEDIEEVGLEEPLKDTCESGDAIDDGGGSAVAVGLDLDNVDGARAQETTEEAPRPPYIEDEEEEGDKRKGAGLLLPRRHLLRAAKRVLRARKLTLLLMGLATVVTVVFLISVVQERMGNFTINLNRLDMYRQGIMLSDRYDFEDPKSRLKAEAVQNATNISVKDLPDNLDAIDGNNNGKDYMAYTFYVRNGGRETVDYYYNILIEMVAKGVDDAVRVAVYDGHTGERTIYAKRSASGGPEPGTVPFADKDVVMENYVRNFQVEDVDKYTVVIWLEGDDPQCVDAIIGGMIRLSMNIEIAEPILDR